MLFSTLCCANFLKYALTPFTSENAAPVSSAVCFIVFTVLWCNQNYKVLKHLYKYNADLIVHIGVACNVAFNVHLNIHLILDEGFHE